MSSDMIISVDDMTYKSFPDHPDGMCQDCAFDRDTVKCNAANEFVSCSETNIVWKPYSKVIYTEEVMKVNHLPLSEDTTTTDPIVAEIRELLLQRSETGISKYGTTLDRKDLKPSEWCQHLLEELLDASGYVLRLKKDLEQIESLGKTTKE